MLFCVVFLMEHFWRKTTKCRQRMPTWLSRIVKPQMSSTSSYILTENLGYLEILLNRRAIARTSFKIAQRK